MKYNVGYKFFWNDEIWEIVYISHTINPNLPYHVVYEAVTSWISDEILDNLLPYNETRN